MRATPSPALRKSPSASNSPRHQATSFAGAWGCCAWTLLGGQKLRSHSDLML